MKRGLCLLLVFLLVVPFSPTPAHAGCCDDFWSCLGAIVTAGLSCAVQEAVEAISNFVKMVRDVRDKGKAELEAAFAKHKEAGQEAAKEARAQMKQMVAEMDKHQKDAQQASRALDTVKTVAKAGGMTQPPAGAAAPSAPKVSTPRATKGASKEAASTQAGGEPLAPGASQAKDPGAGGMGVVLKLADPDRMKKAMKEGEKQVSAERDKMKNQTAQAMEQKAKQTESEAAKRVVALQTLLNTVFIAPLAGILAVFAAGDPITLAVSIAVMTAQLNAVKKALAEQVDPAMAKAADDQQKMIDQMQQHAQDAARIEDKTQQTVELMQKLEKNKLQATLEALEKQLGIRHDVTLAPTALQTPMVTQRATFKAVSLHLSSKEYAVVTSRALKTDLEAPIAMATNFQKPTPPPVTGFQTRVNTDLENHFRGRAGADLTRKRDDLIAEARVYFAKDPKTLEAVEKYLREQATARGAR